MFLTVVKFQLTNDVLFFFFFFCAVKLNIFILFHILSVKLKLTKLVFATTQLS